MFVTAREYKENPYCAQCLPERLAKASAKDPVVAFKDLGNGFVKPIRLSNLQGRDRDD